MPRFLPFTGLRYSHSHIRSLDDVICPPYDVISETERLYFEARSPSNVVRLELPADDGDATMDRYQRAGQILDGWRDGGILRRDSNAAFYGYRMTFKDLAGESRSTVGVLGALGVEPPGAGILPHEQTILKAKTDRLMLLRATRANISPIWGLSPSPGLSRLLAPPSHPADHAIDDDGVRHELWAITDSEQISMVSAAVGAQPVLIADGHHRFETALAYRDEQAEKGAAATDDNAIMALVVELSEQQLTVQAIHRLLVDLPPGFDLMQALPAWFDLTPTASADETIGARMEEAEALAVLTPEGTWLARPRSAALAGAPQDLDSSRLDIVLAGLPPHQVVYQHGWRNAAAAVATCQAAAAVLLRPATVAQIAAISRGGMRMPAKTTFFWPKPRTGMVIRELLG